MSRGVSLTGVLALVLVATASGASAQAVPKALASAPEVSEAAVAGPRSFAVERKGVFRGKTVSYRVSLDETIVKTPAGQPGASLFNFSYVAKGGDPARRPVIFVFNGGPGGASNFLHMGALGPRRMEAFTPAAQADPNVKVVDNPYSPLDFADMVFIDPPETGFSRLLPGVASSTFHSVDADSYAYAQFIALWLKQNGRMDAPVYLIGESYGTLRAVGIVRELANAKPQIKTAGVVLVSQAITFGTGRSRLVDPLASVKLIPQYAALAWYHGKIDKTQSVDEAIEKARAYARTDYISALLQGNRLTDEEREAVAQRLQALTGLSAQSYLANNLRPGPVRTELLKAEGKVLEQYDGREFEPPRKPGETKDWDATLKGVTLSAERYARDDLKVTGLGDYVSLALSVGRDWNYGTAPEPTLDLVLAEEMRRLPQMKLLVTQGIYDTTTGIGSTEYTMSQIDLPKDRYRMAYYQGGHMLYSDWEGLKAFTDDLKGFVTAAP